MKHVPIRMCVACRRRRPKGELLRILVTEEGFVIDPSGKRPGRGAYVCPDTVSYTHLTLPTIYSV